MKYLRMTLWLGRKANPMTSIIPERDIDISIHSAANQQRTLSATMMGPPVEVEVHEVADSVPVESAVIEIIKSRPEPLTPEQHAQLTVFDWAMDLLDKMKAGGVVQTTEPAPLDVAALTATLTEIAAVPTYRDQTFNMTASDLTGVALVRGEVITSRPS